MIKISILQYIVTAILLIVPLSISQASTLISLKKDNVGQNKFYWLEDVSSDFTYTESSVEPKSRKFKSNNRRQSYFNYDVNATGKKILTTIYDDNSVQSEAISNTVFYLDLKTKKAFKITFPFAEKVYSAFIDNEDFLVRLKLKREAFDNSILSKKVDSAYGALYRFDSGSLEGKLVDTPENQLCGGDLVAFDVTRGVIYLSADSIGICGGTGYSVVGEFVNKYKVKNLKYTEMRETYGVNKDIEYVDILNYGGVGCQVTRHNDECNINEHFFKLTNRENKLVISTEKYKDISINEHIPDDNYLFPVWKKSYDGLEDVSSTIKTTIVDDKLLQISINVIDDELVTSNSNVLNNDHVELWFYTAPTSLSNRNSIASDKKVKTLGLSHYSVNSEGEVSLLDKQRHKALGVPLDVFLPSINGIKSSFTITKQGYTQLISVPLDALPFYQLEKYSQCLNVMVDVIDVDSSNSQETLLSTNIQRKWGSAKGFTEFCFSFDNYSKSKLALDREISISSNDGDYAVLLNENNKLNPYKYTNDEKYLTPFPAAKEVKYTKFNLVKLPQDETRKIELLNVDDLCSVIEDVYHSRENDILLIMTKCNGVQETVHFSLLDLRNKNEAIIPLAKYNTACYRYCESKFFEYNYSNIEYGVLGDDIYIIKVDKEQFFFYKKKNIWGEYSINKPYELLIENLALANSGEVNSYPSGASIESQYEPKFIFKEQLNLSRE